MYNTYTGTDLALVDLVFVTPVSSRARWRLQILNVNLKKKERIIYLALHWFLIFQEKEDVSEERLAIQVEILLVLLSELEDQKHLTSPAH